MRISDYAFWGYLKRHRFRKDGIILKKVDIMRLHAKYKNVETGDIVELNDVAGDSVFIAVNGNYVHMTLERFLSIFRLVF